jgi:hypothetical protein
MKVEVFAFPIKVRPEAEDFENRMLRKIFGSKREEVRG